MTKPITRNFIIERTHFRNLEDALSIAVPAAQSLGYDTGIFWMRGSVFAATPYALVGLADSSLSLEDESDCFAISQIAAKQLLAELQMPRSRFLEKIGFIQVGNDIIFTFDYDSRLKMSVPSLLSHYLDWWYPRMTPRERYALLDTNEPYFTDQMTIGNIRECLQDRENCGFITFGDLLTDHSQIPISRLLLLSLIKAFNDDDEMLHMAYYNDQHCITFRIGDVIAIVSTID
jgi:hypothetical protein